MTADALSQLDTLNARLQTYPLPDALRASIEADWEVTQTYNIRSSTSATSCSVWARAWPL
jgi:hypothetical protein